MRYLNIKTLFTFTIFVLCQLMSLNTYADSNTEIEPITTKPWQEVVVSTYDIDEAARFFFRDSRI